jgi:hypothetical protein
MGVVQHEQTKRCQMNALRTASSQRAWWGWVGNTGLIIDIDLEKKYEKKRKKLVVERWMCLV